MAASKKNQTKESKLKTPEPEPVEKTDQGSDVWEPPERPTCPECGEKMNKKGHQIFRSEPHKRKTYQCKECGASLTPSPKDYQKNEE